MRDELCPVGYKISDHPRTSLCCCEVGLIYRELLSVRTIDAGEKESFEPSVNQLITFAASFSLWSIMVFLVKIFNSVFEIVNSVIIIVHIIYFIYLFIFLFCFHFLLTKALL